MKFEKFKRFLRTRGAKSLAVLLVVLLIGAAVYVNYRLFYEPVDSMGFGDNNMTGGDDSAEMRRARKTTSQPQRSIVSSQEMRR